MKALLFSASTIALTVAVTAPAFAQDASGAPVQEVVVTGTRTIGVKAEDSAAPIQVVGAAALTKTGATDLATALTSSVPSLNIDTTGGDTAGLTIQASLRGLSPNDTLVLVDGKRRHPTSNLGVDSGSPYSGSATADLSFIPVGAIDHVEVLTDGAAAQYGTDAVAGVVNIILKKGSDGGTFMATGGTHYDGQGAAGALSFNKGFNLDDKGYVNITLEEHYQKSTVQGIGDVRFQNPDGGLRTGLSFPNSNAAMASDFPYENKADGTPSYNVYNAEFNAAYKLTDNVELYGFGTFGYRTAKHAGNYRSPNEIVGTTSTGTTYYPLADGFSPEQEINETDYSITGGLRGQVSGWHYDLGTTYGDDDNKLYVVNSANAQLFPVLAAQSATPITAQRNFYNGDFDGTQWATTLDIDKSFPIGLASPLNVAFGGEYRRETFTIGAGEPASYFGGGSQSYDGLTPLDEGEHARTNYAGYIDFAVDPITNLHVDLAGRLEHYSDFGDAQVGKFTARYDFSPMFAVRGTASTGFRAPTLAEEYYSGTNVSPTFADVQLPPNSAAAQLAGFQPLKPEKSINYSVGFVAHPIEHLQITADLYDIHLRDRIEVTGFVFGSVGSSVISQGVLNAIAARGVTLDPNVAFTGMSIFTNAATTTTTGLDVTANYASDFGHYGHVDWTLGLNYNHTQINQLNALPSQVTNASPLAAALGQAPGSPILSVSSVSALKTETPPEKVILQALWSRDKWSVNLRSAIYGPTSAQQILTVNDELFTARIGTTAIFDLDIAYKVTSHIKLDVGANNLFDTIPGKFPNIDGLPANNNVLAYGVPIGGGQGGFAPFGVTGGYYYGRVTYTF